MWLCLLLIYSRLFRVSSPLFLNLKFDAERGIIYFENEQAQRFCYEYEYLTCRDSPRVELMVRVGRCDIIQAFNWSREFIACHVVASCLT